MVKDCCGERERENWIQGVWRAEDCKQEQVPSFSFCISFIFSATHNSQAGKWKAQDGATKSQKTLWAPAPHLQFPIRAITVQCKAKVKRNIANPQVCSWCLSFWEIGFYLPVMISTMDPSLLNKSDFTLKQASYFHNCCNSNLARVSQKLKFWHN